MPAPELFHRHDRAILTTIVGRDRYSEPICSEPIELMVRWEVADLRLMGGRREVVTKEGNTVALDAVVVVDRVIEVGSLMWKGSLEEWLGHGTGSGSASPTVELMQVVLASEIPDLKGRVKRRVVGLMKFKSLLPESV